MSNVLKGAMLRSADDIRPIPVKEIMPRPQLASDSVETLQDDDADTLLTNARREAEQLLAQATEAAAQLVADARAAADSIRTSAHAEGYQAGLQQGHLDGQAEGLQAYQKEIAEAGRIAEAVKQSHLDWLSEMTGSLVEVVSLALRHLLLRELQLAPANLEQHVTQLLQHVSDAAELEVHVHPDDFEQAKSAHGLWQSSRYGRFVLNIVPDLSIHPGGAELRSNTERVDGTIETQLARLSEVLHDLLERGQVDAISQPVL